MNIYEVSSIILLIILALEIFLFEFLRKTKIDFYFVFNFCYLVFFSLIPIFIIISPYYLFYDIPANWALHFSSLPHQLVPAAIFSIIFYTIFFISSLTLKKIRFVKKETETKVKLYNNNILFEYGILFLLFGVFSFLLYSTTMGGPINTILYAQQSRSGTIENSGIFTFFKHFMKIVYFSNFIFITVKPTKKIYILSRKPLLILSFVVSIIVLLAYSGRANIVIFVLTLTLYKNILYNVDFSSFFSMKMIFKYLTYIIIFGIVAAYFRPFMNWLGGYDVVFNFGTLLRDITASIIKIFSVPYISLMVAIENHNFNDILLGTGFLQIILDIIPKSIINPDLIFTVNNLNTAIFGYGTDTYNINSGLLAYFFYEFYWLGAIIGPVFTSIIIKIFNDLLKYLKTNTVVGILMVYFLFNLPNQIMAGDQVNTIKSFLILYLGFIMIIMYAKFQYNANNTRLSDRQIRGY